jgi:hypothetical protein
MAIDPNVRAPYQSVAYGAYVEITDDTRFPSVSSTRDGFGGTRTAEYPHYALLTKDIDAGTGSGNLPIAAGEVTGYSSINKFGATDGDVTDGTIWDGNSGSTVYPYPAAGVITITSASNAGADVEVQGLDSNFEPATEVVAIGGTGSTTFSRIFRAIMVDTNNDSDVTINQGGSIAAKIIEDQGQTLMAVYTVPAGKTAYLTHVNYSSDKAATNSAMQFRLFARPENGTFNIKGVLGSAGGAVIDYKYNVPLKFTEKTDIKIDLVAAQATTCTATFEIILVDNV